MFQFLGILTFLTIVLSFFYLPITRPTLAGLKRILRVVGSNKVDDSAVLAFSLLAFLTSTLIVAIAAVMNIKLVKLAVVSDGFGIFFFDWLFFGIATSNLKRINGLVVSPALVSSGQIWRSYKSNLKLLFLFVVTTFFNLYTVGVRIFK